MSSCSLESTQPGTAQSPELAQEFVAFAVQSGVLRFGSFVTKAGRTSPYFFNAGLFDDGAKLHLLGQFYARCLLAERAAGRLQFDMLFGPAYKGIPLVAAVAVEMARQGCNLPFAYNRKETKSHGEGGSLVGAKLAGKVLIVDDVMSAGTAVGESIALIQAAGATAQGVVIALDRQEKATAADGTDSPQSAVQFVRHTLGLQVCAIARLEDLLAYLAQQPLVEMQAHHAAVNAYRLRYGIGFDFA